MDTVAQPAATESNGVKMSKIMAVAWSPNNRKLAVCTVREGKGKESVPCVTDWPRVAGWLW